MEFFIILLLFIPCYVLSIAIHELGHIIAGTLSDFKFYLFVVGPIGLKRNNNKLSFYLEKNPAFWGGVSATLPQNNIDNNYSAFAKVLLAGPIFSVIFGAIFILIGLAINNMFFNLLGFMSLGMGVACLVPMRSSCFYTDGGRWLRMRSKGQDGQVEMAIWNINQTYIMNNNFSNIDLKETEVLKNDKDIRNQYLGYYYSYKYHKDNNNFESAEREKEKIAGFVGKVPKNYLRLFQV